LAVRRVRLRCNASQATLRSCDVPSLTDYLDVAPATARSQWRDILGRSPRPSTPGFRQAPFTPVETLLCLAATAVVSHRHYGGSTSQLAPSPVPELARLFQRTPASILAKQANLDGSRPNGARHEVEAAQRILSDPGLLQALYGTILEAARSSGVVEARLPDFLGLEGADRFELLGQDELANEDLERAVEPDLARLAGAMGDIPESVTERLLIAAARIGQHRFATDVLTNYQHSCGFCGMRPGPGLERKGLLVASHIKPWRESTSRERLDATNGIAACPSHDTAFDAGLLWVNGGYRIHYHRSLVHALGGDVGMRAAFGRPPLSEALVLTEGARRPAARYLSWHRENVVAA